MVEIRVEEGVTMQNPGSSLWRWITIIISAAGITGVAVVWNRIGEVGPGNLLLCSLPFLIGAAAALARIEARNRILLLWLAALIAGFVAVLTLFAGPGIIIFGVMLAYLIAAWGLNEAGEAPRR